MVLVRPTRKCYKILGMRMHCIWRKVSHLVRNLRPSIGSLSRWIKMQMSECLCLCTPSLPFPLRPKCVLVVLSLLVFVFFYILNYCDFVFWLNTITNICDMMLFPFITLFMWGLIIFLCFHTHVLCGICPWIIFYGFNSDLYMFTASPFLWYQKGEVSMVFMFLIGNSGKKWRNH